MKAPKQSVGLEDLVLAFRRKIMETCRNEGLPYDLTLTQVEIVRYIGPGEAVTLKAVADHLQVTPPSASAMVTELEKKKVIERVPGTIDRRTVSIRLTKKATTIYEAMRKHKETIMDQMLSKLSPKDKKTLERIITTLISK